MNLLLIVVKLYLITNIPLFIYALARRFNELDAASLESSSWPSQTDSAILFSWLAKAGPARLPIELYRS